MKWALCTVSSGYYPKIQTLGQSWNSYSAEMASDALSFWEPYISGSLIANEGRPLASAELGAFVSSFTARAKEEGCELVFCYFVGHTLVNRSGETALLMGDAGRDDVDAYIKSTKSTDQVLPPSKLLPLAKLYSGFEEAHVPFVMLVDGCMEFEMVRAALLESSFAYDPLHPGSIHYIGPKDVLGPGDFEVIYKSLKNFGKNEEYLTGVNPVVFASKPGTFARARPNPVFIGGPSVGPLAERLHLAVRTVRSSGQPLPGLDELTHCLGIWRGLGEIGLQGAISWSDFDQFEANARRYRPGGSRAGSDATIAVTRHIEPELESIEDLAFDAVSRTTWLQIKTVEPSGRNRWDLWRWQPGHAPVKFLNDVPFPRIARLPSALAVYRESEEGEELVRISDAGGTSTLFKGSLDWVSSGFGEDSLLLLDADNIVDQGGDRLLRVTVNSQTALFTQELSQAKCVIEPAPGVFAWLDDDHEGTIETRTLEKPLPSISVGDIRLMALVSVADDLYAIDQKREQLFRVRPNRTVESAWLLDDKEHPLVRFQFGFGGMWAVGSELWLASSNSILCLVPQRLTWAKVR